MAKNAPPHFPMRPHLGVISLELAGLYLRFLQTLLNQPANARAALAVDEAHLALSQVGKRFHPWPVGTPQQADAPMPQGDSHHCLERHVLAEKRNIVLAGGRIAEM